MLRRLVPLGLALVSAAAFGTSGPLAKPLITAGLGPLQVAWMRVAGAAVLVLPMAVRHRSVVRTEPALVVGYGVLAVAGVQAAYFGAVSRLPVSVALLVEYLGPTLVLVVARFGLGRRVPRAAWVGAAVTLLGLAAVVEVWAGLQFDPLGLALALLAAVCLASYFLLSERGDGADPVALLGWGLVAGALVLTLLARPWTAAWSILTTPIPLASHEVPASMVAFGLALIGTVVAYLAGIAAVRRLSAPVAAVIASLEAVVASAMAWGLLGEAMSRPQVIGGAVVLLGAGLAQVSTEPPDRVGTAANPVEPVPAETRPTTWDRSPD